MLTVGTTIMTDRPIIRPVELGVLAADVGFDDGWLIDSHVLWPDSFVAMTLLAERTNLHLGTCVSNPITRHWSMTASSWAALNELSGGRMKLGIGRGDSALRSMGRSPATVRKLEEAVKGIKALVRGEEAADGNRSYRFRWAQKELHDFPVYVAGYGPKVLRMAGRLADGVILQIADPYIVSWCLEFVKQGAQDVDRDFKEIRVQCSAAGFVSEDVGKARDQVRWYPALISNHVMDLLENYQPQKIPAELADYVKLRQRNTYDYEEHARWYAKHASFVPDEIVDRFAVIGSADACLEKLKHLESVGVTEFNLYSYGVQDSAQLINDFGSKVLPKLR